MPFQITPQGFARPEVTTNGTDKKSMRFLKHECNQIPLDDYLAQREMSDDVISNIVKIIDEGRYYEGINAHAGWGDPNINSDSGHAINWIRTVFAGNPREKDHYWQRYNAEYGVVGSPIQAHGSAYNTYAGFRGGYQSGQGDGCGGYPPNQGYRQPSPDQMYHMEQQVGGTIGPANGIADLVNRIKGMSSAGPMPPAPGYAPGTPVNPFGGTAPRAPGVHPFMGATQGAPMMPGMLKHASAQIHSGPNMMPGQLPQTAYPVSQNSENPAEDLRSRREQMQSKFANSGAFSRPKTSSEPEPSGFAGEKVTFREL